MSKEIPVNSQPRLTFRPPSTSSAKISSSFTPPSIENFQGPWHVTHATLPMWKSNRNVVITYTPLESPAGCVDDLVEYQPIGSDKKKSIHGIDTPADTVSAAYNWRGKGWLKVASSYWEILGYGDEDGGWAVTYFGKTLFTPVGIDIYARRKGGLSQELIERIKAEIKAIEDPEFQKQADDLFDVKHDW